MNMYLQKLVFIHLCNTLPNVGRRLWASAIGWVVRVESTVLGLLIRDQGITPGCVAQAISNASAYVHIANSREHILAFARPMDQPEYWLYGYFFKRRAECKGQW